MVMAAPGPEPGSLILFGMGARDPGKEEEEEIVFMTKKDLIKKVAKDADISKAQAKNALEAFLASTTKTLQEGRYLILPGFGSFTTKRRAARVGRNPRTGEKLVIPARRVVKFRPGKKLSESISNR